MASSCCIGECAKPLLRCRNVVIRRRGQPIVEVGAERNDDIVCGNQISRVALFSAAAMSSNQLNLTMTTLPSRQQQQLLLPPLVVYGVAAQQPEHVRHLLSPFLSRLVDNVTRWGPA